MADGTGLVRLPDGGPADAEFRILGPLEVIDDDRGVALGGPKQRALLAALLLHRNEVVSSDRLIDLLWGEHASSTAAATLRVHVSNLRKALGGDALVTRNGGYLLAANAGAVDADQFLELVGQGRGALAAGDTRRACELLGAALKLWRGEPLADLADQPSARGEVARLVEAAFWRTGT